MAAFMPQPLAPRLIIDLDALARNYTVLTSVSGVEVAPVIKADGYGLGATKIAIRLWAEGARRFFVARLGEGERLRRGLGPTRPAEIFVLDGFTAHSGERFTKSKLTPVINTLTQISDAKAFAKTSGDLLTVALHVDTGMNRQGLTLEETDAVSRDPEGLRGLRTEVIMSHLGSANASNHPRNAIQLRRFQSVLSLFPGIRRSLSASAGTFLGDDFQFDLVRPGVSLFGGGPEEVPDDRLEAVATLLAPVLDIREIPAGEFVGYGSDLKMARPARVAIVAAGYADGLLRAARGKAFGWIHGKPCPMLLVNMDLIALEIGDMPVRVGDWVELMGPNAKIDLLAAAAGTVAHECLVRMSSRAKRVYVGFRG